MNEENNIKSKPTCSVRIEVEKYCMHGKISAIT
jgi:hypothetical protein